MSDTQQTHAESNKKRNRWLATFSAFFLLVGLVWLLYWFFIGRFYIYTEDAYVHGNEVLLTPQVAAGVQAIYADETNFVKEGQLVVALDPTDFEIEFETLKEILSNTVREVHALFQDVEAKEAQVALRKAEWKLAEFDYTHREPLVKTGAVSQQEYETYQTNLSVRSSALEFAQKELLAAQSLIAGTTVATHPRVERAAWQLRQAYLNIIRCQIWAPVSGYIAKRIVQVGDLVHAGQTLLTIVPLQDIWLDANYKETQLRSVRIGQPVEFTADIYGKNIKYQGFVMGFQPGSGNAFALLPPENAAGNWIKIIQRVPVRIGVNIEEIRKHPLFLGLSMRVTIDVHDSSGEMLSPCPTECPLYQTSIYTEQTEALKKLDPIIHEIIYSSISKRS